MTTQRRIARIVNVPPLAPGFAGPGHTAAPVISMEEFARTDPFIALMDDHLDMGERQVGGAHPHAGFETVTLVLDGTLHDPDEGGLIHAGEVGGPEKIREAIEILGVERIGHGIAAINDPALMDLLADRRIPLEVCPQSNIRTGALALQLRRDTANIDQHPLPALFRHGIPIVLSTDDPAMFHATLVQEYEHARQLGMSENELLRLAQMSFDFAFDRERARTAD